METDASPESPGLEVRTYFVRGRNALVARADFGDLYVDYYLHQGQHAYQHTPEHDELLKEALGALTLHCASRPRNEVIAWTIHLEDPLLNLFVAGNNPLGTIVGQLFTDDIMVKGHHLFLADVVRGQEGPRRSAIDFEGIDPFRAVEQLYAKSEQRPARYFRLGPEEFVMISAQPGCDVDWLDKLTDEQVRALDAVETLSLLETRAYRWECGCTQQRMLAVLAPHMTHDPDGLFGDETSLRMSCPRCGARHIITRETLEAFVESAARS